MKNILKYRMYIYIIVVLIGLLFEIEEKAFGSLFLIVVLMVMFVDLVFIYESSLLLVFVLTFVGYFIYGYINMPIYQESPKDYEELRSSRKGILTKVNKVNGRNESFSLKTKDTIIDLLPHRATLNFIVGGLIEVGDSIKKERNDFYVTIIKPDGRSFYFPYILITYEMRLEQYFPEECRCKNLEFSEGGYSPYKADVLELCKKKVGNGKVKK